MQETDNFRNRGDVDNQIGSLHNILRCTHKILPNKKYEFQPLKFECHKLYNYSVDISKNVLPKEFAIKVRQFLNNIYFDNSLKLLNDCDNQPKTHVMSSIKNFEHVNTILNNNSNNNVINNDNSNNMPNNMSNNIIKDWTYEKYNPEFWRILPITLEAFICSPIIELFDILHIQLYDYMKTILNLDMTKYSRGLHVIQRVEKDYGISLHTDDWSKRKLAFVYYLTSDDWNYEQDGGDLCIHDDTNPDIYTCINPEFNSMVTWDMITQKSPLHSVNKVKSNKPRFTVVGFYCVDDQINKIK